MQSGLNDIQIINQKIIHNAEHAEWDVVAELTIERHRLIQSYCERQGAHPSEKNLLEVQNIIQICDDKLGAIITQQKESTIQSNLNLRKSFKAANRYQSTQRATSN